MWCSTQTAEQVHVHINEAHHDVPHHINEAHHDVPHAAGGASEGWGSERSMVTVLMPLHLPSPRETWPLHARAALLSMQVSSATASLGYDKGPCQG